MMAEEHDTAHQTAGPAAQAGRGGAGNLAAHVRNLSVRAQTLVACVGAALVAQLLLDQRALLVDRLPGAERWLPLVAAVLYGLSAVLWVLLVRHEALEAAPSTATPDTRSTTADDAVARRSPRQTLGLVVMAVLLGALAYPRFTGNRFTRDGTLCWLLSLLLLALAAWQTRPHVPPPPDGRDADPAPLADCWGLHLNWYLVGLLLVMAVGAFYRFFRINVIPLEMGPDLPHNYNNIRQILQGEYPIFFPSHPGREALFYYLAAPFCRLFGLNHTNIKVAASLIGLATLPAVYLLGKELYDREVGLGAAFFLGISRWHIILGRVGYRATLVPLMISLTWYFLVRGLKTGRTWFYALSGFFLGLGMYTYNAYMAAPFVVLGVLLSQWLVGRGRPLLAHWRQMLLLVLVALFVFIPLGRFAIEEPGTYGYRAATRITSLEQQLPANVVSVLFSNLAKALLMFNVQGDGVHIANVPFQRELGFFSAVLFVLGLAYVLWRWRRGYNVTVLIVGMGMLLPSALALAFPNEVPNAIRAIGVLPAAAVLSAVAVVLLRRRLAALVPAHPAREINLSLALNERVELAWRRPVRWSLRHFLVVLAVVVLGLETWSVYPFYFRDYVQHLPDLNYSISLQMARAIDAFADDGQSFIKIAPYWYDGNAVRAQLRRTDPNWNNELETLDPNASPLVGPAGKVMVLVHPDDQEALRLLREAFPRGVALVNLDNTGKIAFITFYGER
jgi:4-amino-4-deoxy-L-arabinose transferase-like glycosyltransferase